MRLTIFILCVMLLASCLTQKKREDITHRYLREHPQVLADLSRLHYPVTAKPGIPVLRPGIPVITYGVDTLYHKKDTVTIERTKTVWLRDTLMVTDTIPDLATINALSIGKLNAERDYANERTKNDLLRGQKRNLTYWIVGLAAFIVIAAGVSIVKFFKIKIPGL